LTVPFRVAEKLATLVAELVVTIGGPVAVGVGVGVGVAVAVAVGVGVGVGVGVCLGVVVGVGVGVGLDIDAQYLPPVFSSTLAPKPPQTIISLPVQTAVWLFRAEGAIVVVGVQLSMPGLYLPPVFNQ
jgi:hypothetical protein